MSKFIFYLPDGGKITKIVECNSDDVEINIDVGEKTLEVSTDFDVSDMTHYVDDVSAQVLRKEILQGEDEISSSVGELKVIPLPEMCRVNIDGESSDEFEVDDGALELEFLAPGEYFIRFEMTHYIKPEVTVHVKED